MKMQPHIGVVASVAESIAVAIIVLCQEIMLHPTSSFASFSLASLLSPVPSDSLDPSDSSDPLDPSDSSDPLDPTVPKRRVPEQTALFAGSFGFQSVTYVPQQDEEGLIPHRLQV